LRENWEAEEKEPLLYLSPSQLQVSENLSFAYWRCFNTCRSILD